MGPVCSMGLMHAVQIFESMHSLQQIMKKDLLKFLQPPTKLNNLDGKHRNEIGSQGS